MPRKPNTQKDRYHDTFPTRLRELLATKKVTQQELSDYLGIKTRQSISGYCDGSINPPIQSLTKIAQFFNVSTDYLLGLSDAPTTDKNTAAAVDYTGLTIEAVESIRKLGKRKPVYAIDFAPDKNTPIRIPEGHTPTLSPIASKFLSHSQSYDFFNILNDIDRVCAEVSEEPINAASFKYADELADHVGSLSVAYRELKILRYELSEHTRKIADEISHAAETEEKLCNAIREGELLLDEMMEGYHG